VLIEHRAHGEIEESLAGRQIEAHLCPHAFALDDRVERIGNEFAHVLRSGKPWRVPEQLAPDVLRAGANTGQCGCIGVDDVALQIQHRLILVAGFEYRSHLRFIGPKLRSAFLDALLQRFVEVPKLDFGFLGGRHIVGHADKADMFSGWIPAWLRFRPHPSPLTVGPAIAPFEHERLQRRLPGNAFLHDALHVIRMQDGPPIERQPLLVGHAEKFEVGLVCKGPRAVDLGDPHRHRRTVGDQAEPFLALAQRFLGNGQIGDVDVSAHQPQGGAAGVAFDPGLGGDPADLSIVRPDDSILR
jgi:hypothetical protein